MATGLGYEHGVSTEQPQETVIHYFQARSALGHEVCLSPHLVFLKACAALYSAGGSQRKVVFEESPFPEIIALGQLPAGYVDSQPAPVEVLMQIFRQQRFDVLTAEKTIQGCQSHVNAAEVLAWAVHIEHVFSRMLTYALWGYSLCYHNHVLPAMRRSSWLGVRPFLEFHCWWRHRSLQKKFPMQEAVQIRAEFVALFHELKDRLHSERFLHGEQVQLDDLMLFAHAQVLLAVPKELAPWSSELSEFAWLEHYATDVEQVLACSNNGNSTTGGLGCGHRLSWQDNALLPGLFDPNVEEENVFNKAKGVGMTAMAVRGRKPGVARFEANGGESSKVKGEVQDEDEPSDEDEGKQRMLPRYENKIVTAWLVLSFCAFAYWQRSQRTLAKQ